MTSRSQLKRLIARVTDRLRHSLCNNTVTDQFIIQAKKG